VSLAAGCVIEIPESVGATYVKPAVEVAELPSVFVTTTSLAPAVLGGVSARMVVLERTVLLAAEAPPKVIVGFENAVPLSVVTVPPAVGPDEGVMFAIVGASARAISGVPILMIRKVPEIIGLAMRSAIFFLFFIHVKNEEVNETIVANPP
jgi:hypothetical protein